MMSLPSKVDVLVVGFGPVGAAAASLLGGHGVRALVIDRSPELLTHPRAIALDNEALRILQLCGLPEGAFPTLAIPYVRMHSPYCGEFARINTGGSIDGHPKLVTFFQPDLERALRAKVSSHAPVDTALGVELTGLAEREGAVFATLKHADGSTATVEAAYVIGADGAGSAVRRLIGLDFQGHTYAEDWLIVDAKHVPRPIDHVEFLCHPRRPTPHMVAPGGRERWEFMLRPGESREEAASDDGVLRLLSRWGRPEEMEIERKAVYRFHARTADAFHRGRVFLAGDAAHITPPFVGQGLVAGLRDAANLCWKLAWVLRHGASPSILDSYDTERRPHARKMIALAQWMGRLVMPGNAATAVMTHGLMRLLRLVPPLRARLEELGLKPRHRFTRGLFVRGRTRSRLVRGDVLPQGWLRGDDGSVRLSDDVFGPSLTLLGFGPDAGARLDAAVRAAFTAAGGRVVQLRHRGQRLHRADHGDSWEDLHGALTPGAAPFGWAAIVRPDRTVLHDGPVSEVNRLVRETLRLLGTPRAAEAAPTP
ncbi:bifunctional 3-(3-hydroxy-phenyl)propionate/3-hydroxycinnamic acid hydroxylase [Myxococcus sp. RHSTA-1-4]|uniref:bifunctional 3-(3-hydroxy-phenyl)propionate/3-hydroxycinnamic acid hydroxylase n=1 Tax=Myxococcus sp. RHSTA-1-4 TaxID=2874601 RepID=UPI001CBA7689|nr:bifunctional 3-(3-hydroxy-phenyl)propionate/3-hydroxycinnamic acid hydroxylase [Myxococcus sp. RHSTA-1-4]MBZ4415508.1 bifunctional 3-(3-hydroxy-phenyl)propionate/3-hydroxycinnamic acid hydroxylase [Myxococcus sp. RHSTA-1-4]